MGMENLKLWRKIENKDKTSSFSEQIKNLKYAIVLSLSMTPLFAQTTDQSNTLNSAQIEVITGDPIKELMAEYKIATIEDIEMMYFDDLVKMLKKVYTITASNNNLTDEEKKIIDKLEEVAEWTKPWTVASIKALSGSGKELSEEEKLRIKVKQQQLADAQQALQTKKHEDQQLDKTVETLDNSINNKKQTVETLDNSINNKKEALSQIQKKVADAKVVQQRVWKKD